MGVVVRAENAVRWLGRAAGRYLAACAVGWAGIGAMVTLLSGHAADRNALTGVLELGWGLTVMVGGPTDTGRLPRS
ncbi:hypothetical protein [Streptomyces sp. NRRL S-350]|uniref:hypothetical protein n=1 Tax=Streptomyces sp. NRRL S-350 TaxID=1463902 RepID=UPI0004C012CF|nr:hypothetical protein [Streptomyces sp. NRRL S-350]